MIRILNFLLLSIFVVSSSAQSYDYPEGGYDQEYSQDNLYHDYAMKQQDKDVGAAQGGWGKVAVGTAIGWLMGGKIHSSRKAKNLNSKHKEEQKALYTQYYNDVYTLQQQNQELAQALEQMGVRVK
ncbi:MAG: hypothetical protein SGBAC_001365 [Bacillariaceae sp.]